MKRFFVLCFLVIWPTLKDFYRLTWKEMLFNASPVDEVGKAKALGLVVLVLVQAVKVFRSLWIACYSLVAFVGYLILVVITISLMLTFPLMFPVWVPLTAARALQYERNIDKKYENWSEEK